MNILSLENIGKSYGVRPLFENVTLGFDSTDKVGIIGANGAGKSTFLKVIAGVEEPDDGRVAVARSCALRYLPQNPVFEAGEKVFDAVFPADTPATRLLRDYEEACLRLAEQGGDDPFLLERVAELTNRLETEGGWDLETNARAILSKLGISDTSASMGALSGGERKRVALASALVARPDLLILDEPTNHLDADTIAWLEAYLAGYVGALLLVTHDRYFLDRVTRRILEIDRGRVQGFAGNYGYYLEKKEEQEQQRALAEQKRASTMRRELAWLRRGAQARSTKQKARVDRAEALIQQPKEAQRAEIDITVASRRMGKKILELRDVSKSYDGRPMIDGFSYTLKRGDRIGVIGPNGIGKTTLLDVIVGRVEPDRGEVETGQTIAIGYYDQESAALDDDKRVIDYILEAAERVDTGEGTITAGQMLERFLFPPDAQYAEIRRLSGGERRRLYLLRILMGAPNVLLLDEPTNDLDIPTLVALEEYLDGFHGCVIAVSHDRYFLDRTVEHIFHFEGEGRVRGYAGNYSAFAEARARAQAEAAAVEERGRAPRPSQPQKGVEGPRKLTFSERRELEELEGRIAAAEARKSEIETRMAAEGENFETVRALYEELQGLDAALERDVERWAELAELA